MTKRRICASALFSLSLLLLFNPNINLLDPLPDFIGYALMIFAIGSAASTVPYLSECRSALGLLALLSVLRIPSFLMMYNNLGTGRDIVPMFTLIFVSVECILLYRAVENGYRALCYIAERTNASSVTAPFTVGKGGKTMSVPSLRMLTYIFFAAKQALNIAPELLLLTTEDTELRRQLREAYPAVLIICIFTACVIGVVWVICARKYVKSLDQNSEIGTAVASLEISKAPDEQSKISRVKALSLALNILAVASIFSFDLTFSDFGNMNILPHFIYGSLAFYAVFNLGANKKSRLALSVASVLFVISSIVTQLLTKRFLTSYEYLNLLFSPDARKMYLTVKIASVFETGALLALLIISAIIFAEFIKENTGTHPSDESYGVSAKKNHRSFIKRGCVLFSLAGLIGVLKCLNVFLKGEVKMIYTEISNEGFATGSMPWMSTLIFALCVIYVLYSFYFIHDVKNEVKFKYEIEK